MGAGDDRPALRQGQQSYGDQPARRFRRRRRGAAGERRPPQSDRRRLWAGDGGGQLRLHCHQARRQGLPRTLERTLGLDQLPFRMIDLQTYQRVAAALPVLGSADSATAREFQRAASLARVPPGRDVFVQGDRIEAIPLLVSGVVRVYQIGESGREVTLYRFHPGESCVLTANAILTRQTFPAIATVEREAEAILIPAEIFRDWVQRHDLWRDFFFDLVSQRLASVMSLVDEVAFRRLDVRVAALLLERAASQNPIRITHQEIAAELGSSREVISRILEDLADRGLVRPERGSISIEDPAGLRHLASSRRSSEILSAAARSAPGKSTSGSQLPASLKLAGSFAFRT